MASFSNDHSNSTLFAIAAIGLINIIYYVPLAFTSVSLCPDYQGDARAFAEKDLTGTVKTSLSEPASDILGRISLPIEMDE